MKNLKIIISATTIAILAVATVGVVLAYNHSGSPYYSPTNEYSAPVSDEDWWNEMQEHMEDHWNEVNDGDWWDEMIEHMDEHLDEVPQEIQEEKWFNDIRTFMEQHVNEVQSQDWFDEITQFMEEQSSYRYNYSPRSYGRGCWDW